MTRTSMRSTGAAVALVTALAAPAVVAGPASAKGDGVRASGRCSGSASWELKAKHEDGRIEIEYEVDANRNGQVWSVRLTDNGTTIFSGTRTTVAPSGSFTVRRLTANRSGADVVRARATHGTQVCRGAVTL